MSTRIAVAKRDDIPEGEARVFDVEGLRLAVCHVEGSYFTVDDICTHDDGPLGEGCLKGFEIECPRHGARFDVRDGAVTRMHAAVGVTTYTTQLEGDEIFVEIEED